MAAITQEESSSTKSWAAAGFVLTSSGKERKMPAAEGGALLTVRPGLRGAGGSPRVRDLGYIGSYTSALSALLELSPQPPRHSRRQQRPQQPPRQPPPPRQLPPQHPPRRRPRRRAR